jgi:hypothetical protein
MKAIVFLGISILLSQLSFSAYIKANHKAHSHFKNKLHKSEEKT